jgi:NAD-dependent deacetylase
MKGIEVLKEFLMEAEFASVLTGAGVSTESGLKDFRGKDGWWKGKNPYDIADIDVLFSDDRSEFVEFYTHRIRDLMDARPNVAHKILDKWQSEGWIGRIITQNVDGFHRSPDVVELHGNLNGLHCMKCGVSYLGSRYVMLGGIGNKAYTCKCGGFVRPNVVLFGESLSRRALVEAYGTAHVSDLLIVMGTSLVVHPASDLPRIVKSYGGKVVIINRDKTDLDDMADLVIRCDKLHEVLQEVDRVLPINLEPTVNRGNTSREGLINGSDIKFHEDVE